MTTQTTLPAAAPRERSRRVRAWFGPHLICEHAASRSDAQAYAEAMPFRFHGLSVTVGNLAPGDSPEPLPPRRLWPLTVC